MDERYYFVFYPAIFLLASRGIVFAYDAIRKYNKVVALVVIVLLLAMVTYQNLPHASEIINVKKDSFVQVRDAGKLVKGLTEPGDVVLVTEEMAEFTYYTERVAMQEGATENKSALLNAIEVHKPKYIIVSLHYYLNNDREARVEVLNFIFTNRTVFTPVEMYPPFIDENKQVPLASVFKIN